MLLLDQVTVERNRCFSDVSKGTVDEIAVMKLKLLIDTCGWILLMTRDDVTW